ARIADAPIKGVGLGIVTSGEPGRPAARFPAVILGPCLAARLAGCGNRIGLPFERAGLGVERLEVAAHPVLAARDADDHMVLDDEGSRIGGDAVLPVIDVGLPDDLAV